MNKDAIVKKLEELYQEKSVFINKIASIDGAISALEGLIGDSENKTNANNKAYHTDIKGLYESIKDTDNDSENTSKKKYVFDDGYHLNMSNSNKIRFVIKKLNRFVHNREIAEVLHQREPEVTEDEWSKKISASLSSLRRKGELVNHSVNGLNRNTFWGSPKWLDSDKEIKESYMYNEKYLQFAGEKIEI